MGKEARRTQEKMAVLATERILSEEVLATEIFALSPPRLRNPVTRLDEWKM